MKFPAISLYCVMLLTLFSFPGISPVPILDTFYPRPKSKAHRMSCSHLSLYAHPQKRSALLGHSDWRLLTFLQSFLAGMCGWCVRWLLATELVVSLGRPQPGSGHRPGLSDVIASFIGSHHGRICAPPRISHTLTAPLPKPTFPLPPLYVASQLLSIGCRTGPKDT